MVIMSPWAWILVAITLLLLAIAAAGYLAYRDYKKLRVNFTSLRVYPEFHVTGESILGAVVGVLTRSFAGAATEFIKGVKVCGKINLVNTGRLPLYFPASEHQVKIEGKPYFEVFKFGSFWLKAGAARVFPVSVRLGKEYVPQMALKLLTRGGKLNIEIHSIAAFGPFKYVRTTKITPGIGRKKTEKKQIKAAG